MAESKNFIDIEEYRELCREHEVGKEEEQDLLLRFLHDLGNVLNFGDPEDPYKLRDTNILNPEWVTEGVYKILNDNELKEQDNKGVLRPGFAWQDALERQIENIKAGAVFVGDSGIGPWQHMEIPAFLREFVKRKCPVIPVILESCNEKPELPVFLGGMGWVDLRKGSMKEGLDKLVWGITGKNRSRR